LLAPSTILLATVVITVGYVKKRLKTNKNDIFCGEVNLAIIKEA